MKRWCASRNALFQKNFKICYTNEYLPATFKIRSSSSMIVLNTFEIIPKVLSPDGFQRHRFV